MVQETELRPEHLEGQAGRPPWVRVLPLGWARLCNLRAVPDRAVPLGSCLWGWGSHPQVYANKRASQPTSMFPFRAARAPDRTVCEHARTRDALLAPGLPRGGHHCSWFPAVSCPRSRPSQHGLFCAAQVREGCPQGFCLSWCLCCASRSWRHPAFSPSYRLRPLRMWGYLPGVPSVEEPWCRGLKIYLPSRAPAILFKAAGLARHS